MRFPVIITALILTMACSTLPSRVPNRTVSSDPAADVFGASQKMDIERMKQAAFARCQVPFSPPVIEPVPVLDPPRQEGAHTEGMVYQEELAVRSSNFLDRDGFYFSPRPRAAVNSIPMDIYVDYEGVGTYLRKSWEDANFDYSDRSIQPPIDRNLIPPAGRVLTELIIGHRSPSGDYPQLFDLRSSGYFRFAGYPPQITGASLRMGAHGIFGQDAHAPNGASPPRVGEDFPVVRAVFTRIKDPRTASHIMLIESRLFCAAVSMEMTEGRESEVVVDNYWYMREDFKWRDDPNTAFIAYSSLLWKTERHTPWHPHDEAHDSDTLILQYPNGSQAKYTLDPPQSGVRIRDLTRDADAPQPVAWLLANEDQDPAHYQDFAPALRETNYPFRASYAVTVLESSVKTGVSLYEQGTDGEYADNIVAASTIRQDIPKAQSVDQFVRFKYRTTAYFPNR